VRVIRTIKSLTILCVLMLSGAATAHAQMLTWDDRGLVAVNVGLQLQSRTFTETSTPVIYGENASITVPHNVSGGVMLDIAGGYRVWRNLGILVGYSQAGDTESPTLAAQIPSPITFGAQRSAAASTGELKHHESAIHLHALWMIPVSDKLELAAIVGPSFWRIKQDFVGDVQITEGPPPFGTVTISGVTVNEQSEGAVGFTAGLDATYLLTPRYGVGGFFRFAGASADLPTAGGGTVTVNAGGVQVGAGLRVRF
jgi:hypothetical protein